VTWPVVQLGEVADTALGKMLDRAKHTGHAHVPYLRNVNVQWGRIDTYDLLTMELAEDERERFAVCEGDLLVCEGGDIGRCAIWHGRTEYLAYQKALHRIRPSDKLDALFLRYLLEHHSVSGQLAKLATGTTIAHLPQQQLRRVPVPLPPLEEQRRIVDLLEDHLSRLDAAETSTRDGLRRMAALQKAHLREAFDRQADKLRPLLDVASIANGQTPKGLIDVLSPEQDGGAVPFFKVGDMNAADGRWMNESRFFVSRKSAERLGLHVRPAGTVLIPKRGGAIATNKKRILASPAAYDLNTMGLVPSEGLDSSYLWHWLQTVDLGRIADGSNVPQINATQIRELQLPVPDLQAQVAVANRLDDIDGGLTRLAEQVESIRRRGGGLRRALLSAAFSGRLTGDFAADLSEAEEMVGA